MQIKNLFAIAALSTTSMVAYSVPMPIPSEAEVQNIIYRFAEQYICPNSQLTLMESAQRGIQCPTGQNLIPQMYKNLLTGEWNADQVMPLATGEFKLFQPQAIENLVNIGNPEAKVVVIEYTDPQCPFCSHFMHNHFGEIKEKFIDSGKVQYRYHHTPLTFHKDAFVASEANYCAADQGAYEAYHEVLLTDTQKQTRNYLESYAKKLNLNMEQFSDCLDSHKYQQKVNKEMAIIEQVSPITYPFFVIGSFDSGKFKAKSIYGAPWLTTIDENKLTEKIETVLKSVS